MPISVNKESMRIMKEIYNNPEKYNVAVIRGPLEAHIIDAGIESRGGFLIGKRIVEICLGGLGEAQIELTRLGHLNVPAINVCTDYPAISTLGSQMAGWRIKVGDYVAMGSGPARALAQKPKNIYEKIKYKDEEAETVIVLEGTKLPPEEAIKNISDSCRIPPEKLFVIVAPTTSIAGLTQISGRVVEVGVYRLVEMGFDPNLILYACGWAPIPSVHPDVVEAMGRSNDAILYGGSVYMVVDYYDDKHLEKIVREAVSSASEDYGRPFAEIFRKADQDFYKIDPKIFAPAEITVVNKRTGKTFSAGRINTDVLMRSIGI